MKSRLLKLLALCFGISLASCSTFYTRHYSKGFFYDDFAHRHRPATGPEKPTPPAELQLIPASSTSDTHKDLPEEKATLTEKSAKVLTDENKLPSIKPKCIRRGDALPCPFLKKALKPVHSKIRATRHSNSIAGKAAFYILALVLAVGILALAIYFLPAIMIPAAASSAFSTILLLGAIVVLCVFAFLIYTLLNLLIDLFKHKKTPEEEEF